MFQPSRYSYDLVSPTGFGAVGGDYGATWRVRNVFTKKGRAENQEARAEYNRKKAKDQKPGFWKDWRTRRADRFDMKSAELTADVQGLKQIEPTPGNSALLWEQAYPWGRRKERRLLTAIMRSKTMEDAAKGYKPGYQLINSEYRATILGGVYILKYAMDQATGIPGVAPYTLMTPETIEVRGVGKSFDDKLLGFARRAARESGKPEPKNLREGAEFIRREVEAHGLAKPAWSHRALLLVAMASKRAAITTAVVGAALAAGATVVTAGAAAPMLAATLTVGAAGAGVVGQVRTAKLGQQWQSYQLAVENALRKREEQITAQQLDAQIDQASSLDGEINAAAAARMRQTYMILGVSALVSVGIIGWGYAQRRHAP